LQVNPADTWLRDECDSSAYFPDNDGLFDLQIEGSSVGSYTTLIVEGATASARVSPANTSSWPLGIAARMGQTITSCPLTPQGSGSSQYFFSCLLKFILLF